MLDFRRLMNIVIRSKEGVTSSLVVIRDKRGGRQQLELLWRISCSSLLLPFVSVRSDLRG